MLNFTENQEAFSKQVPKNLMSNVLYFILNVIFINALGVASYALIPLVTSIPGYVNLLLQSLNTLVSRYLTIDLQKKEFGKANITFNNALFRTLGIILLMFPFVVLVFHYSPSFIEIPSNQKNVSIVLLE